MIDKENMKEAIGCLKYLISGDCCDTQFDYIEEVELGIKALKACQKLAELIAKQETLGGVPMSFIKKIKTILEKVDV